MKRILIPFLSIILMLGLSSVAFAANSPGTQIMPNTQITVDNADSSVVTAKIDVTYDSASGTYTLTVPTVSNGHNFANWVITGDYTIVSGSLADSTITVKFANPAAVTVAANYTAASTQAPTTEASTTEADETKADESEDDYVSPEKPEKNPANQGSVNTSPASPVTGSSIAFLGLAAIIAGGVAIKSKKR
jgi:hypothetical protein